MKKLFSDERSSAYAILLILLAGFGLRVHQLGRDSFWNDEAGQALAAIQPTVLGMFTIEKSHAMAMPLDYFVARVVSHVSTQEFILRFPAAVWGTLTLAMVFVLGRKLAGRRVAALTMLLLSLSATQIRYSQELRFYAALGFFFLLSTWTLYRALKRRQLLDWSIFILATSVGSYFHPYVLLTSATGLVSILFSANLRRQPLRQIAALAISSLLAVAIFLPGYAYFGAGQEFHYDLLQQGGTVAGQIFVGLGWNAAQFSDTTPVFGLWELLNVVFAGVGLWVISIRRANYTLLWGLIVGVFLQVVLIISADQIKGYWLVASQLIHLAPAALLLTSVGLLSAMDYLADLSRRLLTGRLGNWFSRIAIPATVLIVCLTNVPRVSGYYQYQRSTVKQIVTQLLALHRTGEPIFVIPGYEAKIYQFYLLQAHHDAVISDLRPTDWQLLPALVSQNSGNLYLAAATTEAETHAAALTGLGFAAVSGFGSAWGTHHALFILGR